MIFLIFFCAAAEGEEERKRVSAEQGRAEMERMKRAEEEERRNAAEEAKLVKERAERERLEKLQSASCGHS